MIDSDEDGMDHRIVKTKMRGLEPFTTLVRITLYIQQFNHIQQ